MEAAERYSGERYDGEVIPASASQWGEDVAFLNPRDIVAPRPIGIEEDPVLEWVHGYDLIEEVEKLVPLNAVVCPYLPLDAD